MSSLSIIVSRDTTAPSVPGQPTVTTLAETSASIAWTPSIDTGGSGLKGYDIELDGAVIANDVPTASYNFGSIFSPGTDHTTRVRSKDVAGNISNFSASRSFTTTTTAPTIPSYALGMANLQWGSFASIATLNAVGADNSVTDAWTGAAVDQENGEYNIVAAEGHTDGPSNAGYRLNLRSSTPGWVRFKDASPNFDSMGELGPPSEYGANTAMRYVDGTMRSVHGWTSAAFANGRFVYAGIYGAFAGGAWSTATWTLSRTGTWQYIGLGIPSSLLVPAAINREAGTAAYAPRT